MATLALPTGLFAAPPSARESAGWWEKEHGRLSAAAEPLVGRAEAVFRRVLAAADSSSARIPRLLVLKVNGDPWAAAIPDGTILLSRGALAICYRGVTPEKGDARLAFILGHELAHQAKDDFWHLRMLGALKVAGAASDRGELQAVASYIEDSSDLGSTMRAREVAKVKELQADGYGIVYMTMAGYDPRAVLDHEGGNFIEEFVSQVTGKAAYEDARHPSAPQRAAFLRRQLAEVADEAELFLIGVRYYQQGRYDEAIAFFDRFRVRFPSREVFNNLGLSWYRLAVAALAGCYPERAFRYRLPALLDLDSLASLTRGGDEACSEDREFPTALGFSIRYLELACGKDPRYLPARLNLASALILAGEPTRALAAAEEVLRLSPDAPEGIMLRAVALYELGKNNGLDASGKALSLLTPLSESAPARGDLLYNLAAIEREVPGDRGFRSHLEEFLRLEKSGPYALRAARLLGTPLPSAPVAGGRPGLKPPIPLGDVQAATEKALLAMGKREMVVGSERISVYRGREELVLARDDGGQELVELVEAKQSVPLPVDPFRKSYGPPRRSVPTPAGETLIYDGLSAEVVNGQVRTLIFFAPKEGM